MGERVTEVEFVGVISPADVQDALTGGNGDVCSSGWDMWFCTRSDGHKGPHMAAVNDRHVAAIWEEVE